MGEWGRLVLAASWRPSLTARCALLRGLLLGWAEGASVLAAVQACAGFAGARFARSLDSGCARCRGRGAFAGAGAKEQCRSWPNYILQS